jgi:hypothetical protein
MGEKRKKVVMLLSHLKIVCLNPTLYKILILLLLIINYNVYKHVGNQAYANMN